MAAVRAAGKNKNGSEGITGDAKKTLPFLMDSSGFDGLHAGRGLLSVTVGYLIGSHSEG